MWNINYKSNIHSTYSNKRKTWFYPSFLFYIHITSNLSTILIFSSFWIWSLLTTLPPYNLNSNSIARVSLLYQKPGQVTLIPILTGNDFLSKNLSLDCGLLKLITSLIPLPTSCPQILLQTHRISHSSLNTHTRNTSTSGLANVPSTCSVSLTFETGVCFRWSFQ